MAKHTLQRRAFHVQARAEAEHLKRSSEGQEVPGLELAALQAKFGAMAAKHEEALGKLAQMAAAKEAAEAAREAAASEAHTHQQHARTTAIRCGHGLRCNWALGCYSRTIAA